MKASTCPLKDFPYGSNIFASCIRLDVPLRVFALVASPQSFSGLHHVGQKEMQVSIRPQRDFSTKWGKRTYEDQHLSSERLVRVAQTCCAPCLRFGFPSRLFCFGCFVAILSWSPPSGTKGNEGQYLSTALLFGWAALSHSLLGLQPAERLIRAAQTCFASCIRLGCPLQLVCFCCFVAILSWSPPSAATGNEGQYPEAMPIDLLVCNL